MRRLLAGVCSLCVASALSAEEPVWKLKGMFGGTYNATSVSDNWTGAEKNSQSWGVKLDATAERDSSVRNWVNTLKEEYGRTKTEGNDEQTSSDIVFLSSVYTWKLSHFINPYVSFLTDTQHWRFADPVTYTESFGNGVWLLNTQRQQLKSRAGLAFKQLFDSVKDRTLPTGLIAPSSLADDAATPGIEERKDSVGGEWITNYDLILNSNVKFAAETRVFSAFNGGASLRWDNSLYVKLSNLVTMQINHLSIYNFDRTPRPAWPQDIEKRLTLAFGLSYNLF